MYGNDAVWDTTYPLSSHGSSITCRVGYPLSSVFSTYSHWFLTTCCIEYPYHGRMNTERVIKTERHLHVRTPNNKMIEEKLKKSHLEREFSCLVLKG